MLKKILFVMILGAIMGLAPVDAQTTRAAPAAASARVKGKITVARVRGRVEAVIKASGQTLTLKDGDRLTDQTEIITAGGASVILVFSNGATLNVGANTDLNVDQFEQDPFSTDLKMSELKAEPGTSTTKLSLARGELVGKVVHLNVDRGSEFTVQTPVGAAGIRGTTFQIIFTPNPDGSAFFQVVTADGTVVFSGTTKTPLNIPAGKQVVVTFNVNNSGQATTTGVTGASSSNLGAILQQAQQIETTTAAITVPANTGGSSGSGNGTGTGGGNSGGGSGNSGGGGSNTSNTPSGGTSTTQSLSPLTGSG